MEGEWEMNKTEKEKMLAGELYIASDPELVAERLRARRLTRLYNETTEEESEQREELLRELFGQAGGAFIEPPFRCDYGSNIYLGTGVFMNFGCIILDCARVEIGDNVFFGPNVQVYTATHPIEAEARIAGPELAFPIKIGNNVWVGGGSIILPGVTIGDNTTIGAGSVVTRDIPSNVVAAGNPCRVIKSL